MYFKIRDKVLLRLYKKYFILYAINAIKVDKLGQRYINLFDVVSKVDKQVYRLNILDY